MSLSLQRETLKEIAGMLRKDLIASEEVEEINYIQTCLFSLLTNYWEEIGEKKQYMNYVTIYKNGEYEESPFGNIISHCDTLAIIKDVYNVSQIIYGDYQNEKIERIYIDNYSFELQTFREYEERIFKKYNEKYNAKEVYDIYRKISKRFFRRYIK